MTKRRLRLGFLASGNGSSARAVVDAIAAGALDAEARLLVVNTRKASALEWAEAAGLPALCVPTAADPEGADAQLAAAMAAHGVELIVMSGYLRRLGPTTLAVLPVPVAVDDTPETLEARVKSLEPPFFVATLQKIASGELTLPG